MLLVYLADVLICCSISEAGDNPPVPYGNFAASKPDDDSCLYIDTHMKNLRRTHSIQSRKLRLISFQSLLEKEFKRNENSPNPLQQCTFIFCCCRSKGPLSTLMNSKMLRFAFQFGNLPLKRTKSRAPALSLNHIKHSAIFCNNVTVVLPLHHYACCFLSACLQAK